MKNKMNLILGLFLISWTAQAGNEVANAKVIQAKLGMTPFVTGVSLRDAKIAILDNGFQGFQKEKGLLPESAEMPVLTNIPQGATAHGLGMAQIIWALTGKVAEGPKFYLLNTNGFSNLKAAIDFVITNKIDLVLYSQVWPFGGNLDGSGFINTQVNRALDAGVTWINAAGNQGGMAYNGSVVSSVASQTELVNLGGKSEVKFEAKLDETDVSLTLSWNDFKDVDSHNTAKDLDVFIYDSTGKQVGSGELLQKGQAPEPGSDGKMSSHAREQVTLKGLDRGTYTIKVKNQSKNFDLSDRLRIYLSSQKDIVFQDRTLGREILPPADNARVITVGDSSKASSVGPTMDGRLKPDVVIDDSVVAFTSGNNFSGSSSAAAMVAANVLLLKSKDARWTLDKTKKLVKGLGTSKVPADLLRVPPTSLDSWLRGELKGDFEVFRSARGPHVVYMQLDPFTLSLAVSSGLKRQFTDESIMVNSQTKKSEVVTPSKEMTLRGAVTVLKLKSTSGAGIFHMPSLTEYQKMLTQN